MGCAIDDATGSVEVPQHRCAAADDRSRWWRPRPPRHRTALLETLTPT